MRRPVRDLKDATFRAKLRGDWTAVVRLEGELAAVQSRRARALGVVTFVVSVAAIVVNVAS